jgi:ketosteroid isomerase-like protein
MKNTLFVLMLVFAAAIHISAQSATSAEALEQEIRRLDIAAAEAVLRKDYDALDRLCAKDFIVNSPRNNIVKGREGVKELIRQGVIDYASFTREIETISIFEKTAIVMGRETLVTNANAVQARQSIERRYTNIWTKKGDKWLLTARHASVVCPN